MHSLVSQHSEKAFNPVKAGVFKVLQKLRDSGGQRSGVYLKGDLQDDPEFCDLTS